MMILYVFCSNGVFKATMELHEGKYEFKFKVDGEWKTNPSLVRKIVKLFTLIVNCHSTKNILCRQLRQNQAGTHW